MHVKTRPQAGRSDSGSPGGQRQRDSGSHLGIDRSRPLPCRKIGHYIPSGMDIGCGMNDGLIDVNRAVPSPSSCCGCGTGVRHGTAF